MKYLKNGLRNMHIKSLMYRLAYEKRLLETYYDKSFLHCTITKAGKLSKLICNIKCDLCGEQVKFKIIYDGASPPRAWIKQPQITNPQHIYPNDKSLCLYDPDTDEWTSESHLFDTFVPWCQQWFIFQRLYEQTGVWLHPERH